MVETQILEKTDAAIAQIAKRITGLAEAHGAEAVELAGRIYQLKAAGILLTTATMFVLMLIAVSIFVLCVNRAFRLLDERETDTQGIITGVIPAAVFGIGGIILGVATIINIVENVVSPLVWASALNPKIALAAHILSRL